MTDIQRHLKGIRKILFAALEEAQANGSYDWEALRVALRKFLPKSYGMGAGRIISDSGESESVPLLLYDVPLSKGRYTANSNHFRVEHVLFVLETAFSYDSEALTQALKRIASVKQLPTQRPAESRSKDLPAGQQRRTIPKDRLPFALLYADHFEEYLPEAERLYVQLHDLLSTHPVEQRPDQLDLIGQRLQYLNPLLDDLNPPDYAMNLSVTPDLRKPEFCYSCKQKFFRQHFYYTDLCLDCGDLNYQKRVQQVNLTGYRVLVTGARVKIGYAVALRLLRTGAEVIATSRFPRDAARRYSEESDFEKWQERLHIYGLDLRQVTRLEAFIAHMEATYSHLDALINNAAQTVKRPPVYYAHLLPNETAPMHELATSMQAILRGNTSDTSYLQPSVGGYLGTRDNRHFPEGQYDKHGQQVDNRHFNSWVMRLENVSPSELAEVHLVNAIAPGILTGQLKRLLCQSPHEARFVVNVSAAEGRFAQFKNGYHPHTNMAKAALNMLTRTIAEDYAQDRIFVTSIDPGWVSDQVPRTGDESRAVANERLPIDMIDAAARVCDPLFAATTGDKPLAGVLLKDFRVVDW